MNAKVIAITMLKGGGKTTTCANLGIGLAQFMGYLKGKSSLMIFDRHTNLKYKYGNCYARLGF